MGMDNFDETTSLVGSESSSPQPHSIKPNFAATASGTRFSIDQRGVLPYHRAVYGPYRPLAVGLREANETCLLDVSLALHCWIPPAAPEEENEGANGQVFLRPTAMEGRAYRREVAEAQRLAAAEEARTFFEEQAIKRKGENTMDGLALIEAVRAARCRPWDVWTKRDLTNAGIDACDAEHAVRDWEPQLFDDPIDSRHVAGCWDAEMDYRNLDSLPSPSHIHASALALFHLFFFFFRHLSFLLPRSSLASRPGPPPFAPLLLPSPPSTTPLAFRFSPSYHPPTIPFLLVSLHCLLHRIRKSGFCPFLLDMGLHCVSVCLLLFSLPSPEGTPEIWVCFVFCAWKAEAAAHNRGRITGPAN